MSNPSASHPASEELSHLAACVLASILVVVGFAMLGPVALDHPAEPRAGLVVGLLGAIAWMGLHASRVRAAVRAREDARTAIGWRVVFVVPALLAPLASGSALVVATCAALVVLSWHGLVFRTIARVWRDRARSARLRASAIASIAVLVLPSSLMASWGLVSSLLQSAASRLVHLGTRASGAERDVEVTTVDGLTLRATFTPAAGRAEAATGVLLVHGYADGRAQLADWAHRLAEQGVPSLRLTLRAHGDSDGTLVTFTAREQLDADAGARALLSTDGVRDDCFVGIGASMGGGTLMAASDALVAQGMASLVAFAPPSDFRALVEQRLPSFEPAHALTILAMGGVSHALGAPSPLEIEPCRTLDAVPELPVLLFHSRADRTVPPAQSDALVRRHRRARLITLEPVAGEPVSHGRTPQAVLAGHFDTVLDVVQHACP